MGWVCLALICHSSVEDNLERCVDSGILEEMNDHCDFFFGSSVLLVPTQGVESGFRVCPTTREYILCLKGACTIN